MSDIDGVICETAEEGLLWIWDRFGVVIPLDAITQYDMEHPISALLAERGISITPEALFEELSAGCWQNPSFYHKVRPRFVYWQALLRWQRCGLPLQLVTRRKEHLRHATSCWLRAHGIEVDGEELIPGLPRLVMGADKARVAELACSRYDRVIFVEDGLAHAEEVAAGSRAEVWVVAQPWNGTLEQPGSRLSDEEINARLRQLADDLSS